MSEGAEHKKPRTRSPAYPSMDLREAVEKIAIVYRHEKRHPVPVAVVARHCDYSDLKSSSSMRFIAAIKQYGLVAEEGSGEDRKVRVSDLALDILLADSPDSPKRLASLRSAALMPEVYKKIWAHFHGNLPSDATIREFLIRSLDFNDTVVNLLIKKFRSTIAYGGLLEGERPDMELASDDLNEADDGANAPSTNPPNAQGSQSPSKTEPHAAPVQPGTAEERMTLDEGPVTLWWPEHLSPESFADFEYWFNGIMRRARRKAGISPTQDAS